MTIALTSSAVGTDPNTTITLTTINTGDVVIAQCDGFTYTGSIITVSSPSLGTFTPKLDTTGVGGIFWAVNTGAPITSGETITFSSGVYGIVATSWSGVNTSSPFDSAGVSSTGNNTGPVSITTTGTNEVVVAECSYSGGASDSSPWVSFGGGTYGSCTEYRTAATATAYSAAFGGATGAAVYLYALVGAGGGGTVSNKRTLVGFGT